jgi:hypothetical protein
MSDAPQSEAPPEDPYSYMTLGEFMDSGLLQEINRLLLHPLGLALAVAYDEAHPLDALKAERWQVGIMDKRSDPEGWRFAEGTLSPAKAESVLDALLARRAARRELLGYLVQSAGDRSLNLTYLARER